MEATLTFLLKLLGTTARIGAVIALTALALGLFVQTQVEPFAQLAGTTLYQTIIVAGIVGINIVVVEIFIALYRLINEQATRRRQRRLRRYFDLYLPLYEQLDNIYITIDTRDGAMKFRDRLSNALDAALIRIRHRRAIAAAKAALRNLFDKRSETRGEVEYGGGFPLDAVKTIARTNLTIADPTLLGLIAAAHRTRIEESISDNDLTEDDIKLYDWITTEHDRLKKLIS